MLLPVHEFYNKDLDCSSSYWLWLGGSYFLYFHSAMNDFQLLSAMKKFQQKVVSKKDCSLNIASPFIHWRIRPACQSLRTLCGHKNYIHYMLRGTCVQSLLSIFWWVCFRWSKSSNWQSNVLNHLQKWLLYLPWLFWSEYRIISALRIIWFQHATTVNVLDCIKANVKL